MLPLILKSKIAPHTERLHMPVCNELSHMQQGIEGMLLAVRHVLFADTVKIALQGHPVLKAELERVRSGLPMAGLDIARYRLDEPSLNRRNDMAAWRSALDNAHSQLEHQYNRYSWHHTGHCSSKT